jgi:hypothetical protein
MAGGFDYLYVDEKHVVESEVGMYIGSLMEAIYGAYEQGFGKAERPPLLATFIDVPDEPRTYDIQIGYSVPRGTPPLGHAQVRYVEPTLVCSILVWGSLDVIPKSYGPLLEFVEAAGYRGIVGWREWYLYWEDAESMNNVTWVQHVIEEA